MIYSIVLSVDIIVKILFWLTPDKLKVKVPLLTEIVTPVVFKVVLIGLIKYVPMYAKELM